ncbi:anti-sigma factor family protein [Paraburkholderia sp. BCC1885]|uniref:anti-sigma factor family protein n=1 Tax=Paraburkholderia sp. BCC1885 TaxID=2562669 RepID=UPI0011828371|nr:transcriptional regulator [Paraburkholderia sp. BCC1885]
MNPTDPRRDPPLSETALSETDIQAYADGFLAPERAAHLRQYLGKRPGEARRVAFYGKLNQQIQDTFLPTDEPLPTLASGKARAHGGSGGWFNRRVRGLRRHPLRALLALVLAVVLAGLAASGWMTASQVSDEALNNAAVMALARAFADHPGAAAGSSHGGSAAPAAAAAPTAAASGTAAAPESTPASLLASSGAPNLAPVGMRLVGQRTLKLGPVARAAEYIYLNAYDQPVVLLTARSRPMSAQPQWSAQRVGTLRLLTWSAYHQRYVLAGAADAHGLMRAADFMTMR